MAFGDWHIGVRYDVRVEHPSKDTYPNDFKCKVEVKDRRTGRITKHAGGGKYVGNFSPIWVEWKGKKVQISELVDHKE